uniref:uncharacterized protein LOC120809641 isoform X1 n=1 Tax=Gasterosteus aculeatus aculeatus TaxID=481459 RepID=UPI001A99E2CE|nr:uncharacterized protein LOC120809641 isoform X1 [Gasterosteus aculeatus aculeatus]XP_040019534.1 uncharacterized protein LOC120809641 isoform X1 [Gasterosteus aculeatus aculeatus]
MSDNRSIVFIDLETTGLNTSVCDIIQLSAVCGKRVFNAYILPTCELTQDVEQVTGFTVSDGKLFRNGVPTSTVPLADALASFLDFLRSFGGHVRLAAHNAKWFDARVLTRELQRLKLLPEFQQVVSGFVDTLPLARRLKPGLDRYTQKNLVSHFLGQSYDGHNAVADATMLQELFNHWNPSAQDVLAVTFDINHVLKGNKTETVSA